MQTYMNIEEYIKSFPKDVQKILTRIRNLIRKSAPNAEETFAYGIPTFKLAGKNLVHFAAFKNHIGFYPVPSGIEAFKNELAPYIKGKGTIQFPLKDPIPYNLIEKVVEFRVKENLQKYK